MVKRKAFAELGYPRCLEEPNAHSCALQEPHSSHSEASIQRGRRSNLARNEKFERVSTAHWVKSDSPTASNKSTNLRDPDSQQRHIGYNIRRRQDLAVSDRETPGTLFSFSDSNRHGISPGLVMLPTQTHLENLKIMSLLCDECHIWWKLYLGRRQTLRGRRGRGNQWAVKLSDNTQWLKETEPSVHRAAQWLAKTEPTVRRIAVTWLPVNWTS